MTPPLPTAPTAAELRNRIAGSMAEDGWGFADIADLDDLVAAVRAEALEEAAKVAEVPGGHYPIGMRKAPWWDGERTAAAIRALVLK